MSKKQTPARPATRGKKQLLEDAEEIETCGSQMLKSFNKAKGSSIVDALGSAAMGAIQDSKNQMLDLEEAHYSKKQKVIHPSINEPPGSGVQWEEPGGHIDSMDVDLLDTGNDITHAHIVTMGEELLEGQMPCRVVSVVNKVLALAKSGFKAEYREDMKVLVVKKDVEDFCTWDEEDKSYMTKSSITTEKVRPAQRLQIEPVPGPSRPVSSADIWKIQFLTMSGELQFVEIRKADHPYLENKGFDASDILFKYFETQGLAADMLEVCNLSTVKFMPK
uniref:P protein n=1 Tax=Corixo rhabdovirus 2 TaxID=3078403 RepID=A0AB38Z2N2_9RHAB